MAQVKVKDSIASLGYMSDSEEDVIPSLQVWAGTV
jgi:hypothetical protein